MLIQGRGQARKHQRKILRIPTIRTALNDGFMRQYPSDMPAGPTSRGESFIDFTLPVIRTPLFSQRKIRNASATVFKKFHQTTAPERTIIKKRGRSSPCATHDIKYGFYDNSSPAYRLNRTNSKKNIQTGFVFYKRKTYLCYKSRAPNHI